MSTPINPSKEDNMTDSTILTEAPLVTKWLADNDCRLTPHAVAQALRGLGRPAVDRHVLDLHEFLFRGECKTVTFTPQGVQRVRAALRFHAEAMVAEAADDPEAIRRRELHAESRALWDLWEMFR